MNQMAASRRLLLLAPLIFANSIVAPAQAESIYRLAAGTRIHLKMDVELSSKVASVNDTFIATVSKAVIKREVVVLPVGTTVEGRVTSCSPAANAAQDGKMEVVFETIRFDPQVQRSIDGRLVNKLRPASASSLPTVLSVIGGTAAGALLGGIVGSGTGALVGAGIGAGAGTSIALLRKGKETRLLKDQEFEIELKKEVVLPVADY